MNKRVSSTPQRHRLAIIGGGSSGLVCLKYASDLLPDWRIVCYEQSDHITGCWGNPYPGFTSTSTKYTTQFACYPLFDASVHDDGGVGRNEFFKDDEYGRYLERFADEFDLRRFMSLRCSVEHITRSSNESGWELSVKEQGNAHPTIERFDCVILCTGLAAVPKQVDCDVPQLSLQELNCPDGLKHVRDQRIVVIGGGESAVDYANRLARSELNNRVFLSLRTGIRVSPRYHPIRGVPSDFLRNRLMLSIHEDLRNWIGQRFVELRIRHQETFERLFPKTGNSNQRVSDADDISRNRKRWAYRLTKAAKAELFNMFHNKSDDFLDAVAEGRIEIVGPAVDARHTKFRQFDSTQETDVSPDLIVPAIGYRSTLDDLSDGEIKLADFYLGCCHVTHSNLYLVGFARPIIGNIPTISEMQARYVVGLISGKCQRPTDITVQHGLDISARKSRYQLMNSAVVYPVEMFPYCDRLARLMKVYPSLRNVSSLRSWCRMQLAVATTMHYLRDEGMRRKPEAEPIYMPWTLVALLLALRPLSAIYRMCKQVFLRS